MELEGAVRDEDAFGRTPLGGPRDGGLRNEDLLKMDWLDIDLERISDTVCGAPPVVSDETVGKGKNTRSTIREGACYLLTTPTTTCHLKPTD